MSMYISVCERDTGSGREGVEPGKRRGGGGERERARDRQTGRQTDRQTDRQRGA